MTEKEQLFAGKITDVVVHGGQGNGTRGNNLYAILENDGGQRFEAALPVHLENVFEAIPYRQALIGSDVLYHQIKATYGDCGMTGYSRRETNFVLDVTTGPMEGQKFELVEHH